MARCPFAPCKANITVVNERAQPGSSSTGLGRVPMHMLEGSTVRYGMCPASLLSLPLDSLALSRLQRQEQLLARMEEEQRHAERESADDDRGEHSKTPHPDYSGATWFKSSTAPAPQNVPPRRPHRRPMGVLGPTDASTNPQPITQQSTQGESTNVSDNMRDQYRALTERAIAMFGEAQDLGAQLTEILERATAVQVDMTQKADDAASLARQAVGAGGPMPETATNMVANAHAARDTVNDIGKAQGLALLRVASAHESLTAAAEQGRQYLAGI